MIRIKNLNVSLNKRKVLNNINLNINFGDCIGLVGANGSGKTILLRSISNIYKNNSITYTENEKIKYIGSLNVGTNSSLTILENINRILRFHGIRNINLKKISLLISEFDLDKFKNHFFGELSQGYRLRVQIIAFLLIEYNALCLDEFIGFGDKYILRNFKEVLSNKLKSNILIIASHNMDLIHKFCNRIIEINDGSIINDYRIDYPQQT